MFTSVRNRANPSIFSDAYAGRGVFLKYEKIRHDTLQEIKGKMLKRLKYTFCVPYCTKSVH